MSLLLSRDLIFSGLVSQSGPDFDHQLRSEISFLLVHGCDFKIVLEKHLLESYISDYRLHHFLEEL